MGGGVENEWHGIPEWRFLRMDKWLTMEYTKIYAKLCT